MSAETTLTPGMRVLCRDAEWLVTRVDIANYSTYSQAVYCVGADDLVRGHEAVFLTDLDHIESVDPRNTTLVKDTSTGYRLSKLFLEAQLRQIPATGVEPVFEGMGAFELMKFQEDTVRHALSQLRPRLLLADAVGLGKTIQVGMVLTELIRRGRADRILVLARKSMLTQFQSELWNRFNIPLIRLDSAGIAKLRLRIPANRNPFEVYHRVIISIDTLKNVARYEHFLGETRWDVVIIDEAHNVAGASIPEKHKSYRLARLLSRRTDAMLLTTATPHNGKRETFGRLISLLDPSAIPDPEFKEYTAENVKDFFLMRFKEDVRNEAGKLLAERKVVELARTTGDATEDEENIYALLAGLRQEKTPGDTGRSWRSQALVQYGIYKLFLSSPEACAKTVAKRIAEKHSSDSDPEEKSYLTKLLSSLEKLDITQSTRFRVLLDQLKSLEWDGSKNCPRVLVFTEYRATQDALALAIADEYGIPYSEKFEDQAEQVISVIHGSTPDIHLMKTVEAFGTGSAPVRIMIATDVASEGINLHHQCHNIIHYDLPWSVITLIQRNGRIDRLGQTREPLLRYIMVNTEQGLLKGDCAIFERLINKVEEINRLRKSGESVLQLYDPEEEEKYIAEKGILAGDVNVLEIKGKPVSPEAAALEDILAQAQEEGARDLKALFSNSANSENPGNAGRDNSASHVKLYGDWDFLQEGYSYLKGLHPDYPAVEQDDDLLYFTAPEPLKRRLGAPDIKSDVISGSTSIPGESWPEHDRFRLTSSPDRVAKAIEGARNTSGYWAKELLCTNQNPIVQWVTESLLMQVKRGEAPFALSKHLEPGELCFCFIGQFSSKAGMPLIVDAHAVSIKTGGRDIKPMPLHVLFERARFQSITNTGDEPNIKAAGMLLKTAVDQSELYMRLKNEERVKQLRPFLLKEERRLKSWRKSRESLLQERIKELGESHPRSKRLKNELEWMNDYLKDREKWRDLHFMPAREPSTKLIAVIGGPNT